MPLTPQRVTVNTTESTVDLGNAGFTIKVTGTSSVLVNFGATVTGTDSFLLKTNEEKTFYENRHKDSPVTLHYKTSSGSSTMYLIKIS